MPRRSLLESVLYLGEVGGPDPGPMVAELRAYAEANYENGMDTMVECWGDDQYLKLLGECGGDVAAAKRVMDDLASVYRERRADADYEGGA